MKNCPELQLKDHDPELIEVVHTGFGVSTSTQRSLLFVNSKDQSCDLLLVTVVGKLKPGVKKL